MAKDIRDELAKYKRRYGLQDRTPCTPAENKVYLEMVKNGQKLPDYVGRFKYVDGDYLDEFFTMKDSDLSREEQQEYLRLLELEMLRENNENLKTIKKCVVFFTALTVISIVAALILYMLAFA